MSRKQSFEEALRQKMNELPLPDENESWQKMKALLNEEEKRRSFLFFRYEKIMGGALLLCALLAGVILFMQTGTKSTTNVVPINKENADGKERVPYHSAKPENNNTETEGSEERKDIKPDTMTSASTTSSHSLSPSPVAQSSSLNNKFSFTKKNTTEERKQNDKAEEKIFASGVKKNRINRKKTIKDDDFSALQKQGDEITRFDATKQAKQSSFTNDSTQLLKGTDSSNVSTAIGIDSNQNTAIAKGNFLKTDSISAGNAAAKATINIRHHNAYFIEAGIGIKQQIPIGDQVFTAYNYNGNKGWLGDYIPSLYVKLEKEKRWFVQGEFHYAAPRLVSKTAYWQKTRADYGHGSTKTDKYYLQKTWYNEVPLSFNLYLRPSLSVGVGVMYNMLRGATGKRETSVYDVVLDRSVYDEKILSWKGYTDSFLYKTNTSLLVQADYHVNKWSFGLRYLQDVQPYLTYTLPDGTKKDKRNASLEVLVRYRLFRSEKFRLGKW